MKKAHFCTVLAAALLPAALWASGGREGRLVGTVLDPGLPSVDFTLVDQRGQTFHLADTRGKVVVVTFLYTHCTDVCSFMAVKMRRAHELLGADTRDVVFVAVTTDPARDTPEVTASYSRDLGMYETWSFLTGTEAELAQVWRDWKIGVEVEKEAHGDAHSHPEGPDPSAGLDPAGVELADKLIGAFGGGYDVSHSAPFWVLDRSGTIRVLLDVEAAPKEIAQDVRILLKG